MAEKQQSLVLGILDFLTSSVANGSIKSGDKKDVEAAVTTIGKAFGVDPSNSEQRDQLSIKPATLQSIFDVYLKTKDRLGSPPQPAASSPKPTPSAADKAKAETHKQAGNARMSAKDYNEAIEEYTKAVSLDPTNPVYYSNRAAAYSSCSEHEDAVKDAEKAIEADSSFVKAYHRLGHAHYCLGNYVEAASAFQKGLELDPSNANLKSGLSNAEARIPQETTARGDAVTPGADPDINETLRNMGMGGGAGGLPDMASMMNNPALMSMAQNMMANGGLERLMANPAIANMMNRVQSGGAMPSMAELMADPTMREMAQNFTGAPGGQR